ncbi:MAG: TetR family transcriptional regulator [Rhodospirillales bacterium]|nr:TetR family transcriptional regulator [Rhodospirillales bacterium]
MTGKQKSKKPHGKSASSQKRDPVATREKLLAAALAEFCENGFSGARTASISARAECNIRLIYHYFGNKDGLYLAALERVYDELRSSEEQLNLVDLDPGSGMEALVEFTFDHMLAHPEFIKMVAIENIQQGRYLRRSETIPHRAMPLIGSIKTLLRRGQKQGVFRNRVDPVQLYVSILSMSYVHVSNRYTLSITFGEDLADTKWLDERRKHVCDMVLVFLRG